MDKLETSARAGGTAGSIAVAEEFRQAGASVVDGDLNGKVVIPAMSPAIGVSIEAAEVRGVAEKMAAGYSYSLNAMLASLLQLSGVKPDQAALATASRAAMDGLTQHPGEGTTARVLSTILSAPTVTDQPEGNIDDVILNPVQMTLVWHLLISDLHDKALGYNPAAGVTTAATPTPLRTALMTAEPGSCVEEKEIQNITNSFFTTSFGGIVEKSIDILSEQLVEEAIESAEKSGTDTNAETNLGRFKLASGLIDVGLAIGILVWTVNLFGAHIAFEKNPLVRTKTTDKYLDEEKLTTTAMYRSAFGDNGEMSACLAIVAALFGKDVDLPNNGEAGPAKGVGVTWKLASGGLETGVTGVTDRGAVELCYSECGNVSTHTDDAGQNQITLRGLPQQHDKANTKTSYNRAAQVYATFDPGDLANDALNNWSHLLSLIKIAIPAFNGNAAGATATALTQMLSRSGLLRTPITSVPVRDWNDEYLLIYTLRNHYNFTSAPLLVDGSGMAPTSRHVDFTWQAKILLHPSATNPQSLIGTGTITVVHGSFSSSSACVDGVSRFPGASGDPCEDGGATEMGSLSGTAPGTLKIQMDLASTDDPTETVETVNPTVIKAPTMTIGGEFHSKDNDYSTTGTTSEEWDGAAPIFQNKRINWVPGDNPALIAKASRISTPPDALWGYTETWQLVTDDQH